MAPNQEPWYLLMRIRISLNAEMTQEELHVLQRFSDDPLYERCRASTAKDALDYLHTQFMSINHGVFEGRLSTPKLYLMKDQGKSFKTLGIWYPGDRKLGISVRLFNGQEIHVLTTLLHEMCHQAVTDIDNVYLVDQEEAGHGKEWQEWMKRGGLTPSRYSKYDLENFMTPEELKMTLERKQEWQLTGKEPVDERWVSAGTMVQWLSNTNEWVTGICGGQSKKMAGSQLVVSGCNPVTYVTVPVILLYKIPDSERPHLSTSEWQRAYRAALDFFGRKKLVTR